MAPQKNNRKNNEPDEVMIVNDSPGEECRIAILQNGHLDELFTERTATATDVGNIYKGRVMNVEPAIQAAFIDYGQGVNGFLHISDLHPKYFPGEERTERVGKKIPRRDRPPIQHALKRGQEILVQVLKEGIGTKGPTLTSYLSIPGRLLVLMPDMDRVGVSRKVEDEEQRREMRQILDSLDLPDGFGFILRTAGYGKTKTELKRDAAYLMRLWKMMEKRIKTLGAPCELYTESDLLIRTVRDVLRPSIKTIIVDSASAFERCSSFLRVVSPRSAPTVIRYRRPTPIFHSFDIERQIDLIHSGEVPLPSGGRLVIDQTEALVAIDVNSGRSRSARDSETNAYETNIEAADEICRQLRLRDLGGLIVNDLIDMRFTKHRKAIEERFQNNLKRDRAKATVLPISEFGIMEMTRQRMRPSIRKSHFTPCAHCNGRGEVKSPEYVAADAARYIGYLLQFDRVKRIEVACSARVGSVMLSAKRRELVRLEDLTGKRIDVRVSEQLAADRVDYYAYDERNADIDVTKLPALSPPTIEDLAAESQQGDIVEPLGDVEAEAEEAAESAGDLSRPAMAGDYGDLDDEFSTEDTPQTETEGQPQTSHSDDVSARTAENQERTGKRRRRRRRGGDRAAPDTAQVGGGAPHQHQVRAAPAIEPVDDGIVAPGDATHAQDDQSGVMPPAGKRRRRRRGGRKHRRGDQSVEAPQSDASGLPDASSLDQTPVRIHDLARELSVTSREVIERSEAEPAIHHLANALSTVSAEEAQTIRDMFADGEQPAAVVSPQEFSTNGTRPGDDGDVGRAGASLVIADDGRGGRRKRRRRGRRRGNDLHHPPGGGSSAEVTIGVLRDPTHGTHENDSAAMPDHDQGTPGDHRGDSQQDGSEQRTRRSRRRRRGRGGRRTDQSETPGALPTSASQHAPIVSTSPQASLTSAASARKPRRSLYRAARVAVSPAARDTAGPDE